MTIQLIAFAQWATLGLSTTALALILLNTLLRAFNQSFLLQELVCDVVSLIGVGGRFVSLFQLDQPIGVLDHPLGHGIMVICYVVGAMYSAYTYNLLYMLEGELRWKRQRLWFVFIKGFIIYNMFSLSVNLIIDLLRGSSI